MSIEQYILFQFDGKTCVAKKLPFEREEKLNGFFYYDLQHGDEDFHFPNYIVRENQAGSDYWGSLMTHKPLHEVDRHGSLWLADYGEDENGNEVELPNEEFVTNIHFYDMQFYFESMDTHIWAKTIDFRSILAVWESIDPHFYPISDLRINRVWHMPSKNTYDMKPVRELLQREIKGGFVIDPFANKSSIGHITNDLNKDMDTNYHMEALDLLKCFEDESADVILLDWPYSPTQIKRVYNGFGLSILGGKSTQAAFWSDIKKEAARVLRIGGKVIIFGWNSNGANTRETKNVFHMNEILLVPHGGGHNDTIITVSVKTKSVNVDQPNKSDIVKATKVKKESVISEQITMF